ncbi:MULTISPECIES: TlpA disulfide reductase family protein [unclassified Agreia]|uniref:TlpA disulfide reductase family protein n=1 Tax=unclassified Agreia TaxID=2641148 RepID=UPI001EEFCC4C|nr:MULTISPECIES: TlpA disulfide reductase family protein [unclassified Agreia]
MSLLTACSNDSLADQYTAGDNKGYIAGDGSVLEIQEDERGEPIVFSGTGENGEPITSAGYTGDVLVVNFWYAACAPCRLEAPDLEDTYQKVKDQGVEFLGVNVRDQAATAKEFSATFGVSYPSIIDINGDAQLSFAGDVAPNAVPTTLILDREGRVAARILGRVLEVSILESLIDGVLQEQA